MKLIDIPDIDRCGFFEIETDDGLTIDFHVVYSMDRKTVQPDRDMPPETRIERLFFSAFVYGAYDRDGNEVLIPRDQEIELEAQLENHFLNSLI